MVLRAVSRYTTSCTRALGLDAGAADRRLRVIDHSTRRNSKRHAAVAGSGPDRVGGGFVWVDQEAARSRGRRGPHRADRSTLPVDGGNGIGIAYGAGRFGSHRERTSHGSIPSAAASSAESSCGRGSRATDWLVFADGSLWSAKQDDGIIRKIDPVSNRVVSQITLHGWVERPRRRRGRRVGLDLPGRRPLPIERGRPSVAGTRPREPDPERISTRRRQRLGRERRPNVLRCLTGWPERAVNSDGGRPQTATYSRGILLAVAWHRPRRCRRSAARRSASRRRATVLISIRRRRQTSKTTRSFYATCANLLGYPDAADRRRDPPSRRRGRDAHCLRATGGRTRSASGRLPFLAAVERAVTAQTFKHYDRARCPASLHRVGRTRRHGHRRREAFRAGKATHISGIVAAAARCGSGWSGPPELPDAHLDAFFCPVPTTVGILRPCFASDPEGRPVLRRLRDGQSRSSCRTRITAALALAERPASSSRVGHRRPRRCARGPRRARLPTAGLRQQSLLACRADRPALWPRSAAARAGDERYLYRAIPAWDGSFLTPLGRSSATSAFAAPSNTRSTAGDSQRATPTSRQTESCRPPSRASDLRTCIRSRPTS